MTKPTRQQVRAAQRHRAKVDRARAAGRDYPLPVERSYPAAASRYMPHNGKREVARRLAKAGPAR